MTRRKLTTETVPISSLKPHPRNYRGHPDEQLEHIKRSIAEHGQYRPVVVSRDSTILAGHGVWMGMDMMMRKRIDVVRLPINAESPEALRILTGDNEISGVAVDDRTALGDLLRELADHDATLDSLLGTGYDATRLVELLAETGNTAELPDHLLSHFHNGDDQRVDPGPSKPAEAQARWKVETGDVWTAGNHRIVCGDAADGSAYDALTARAALCATDPPYNVGMDYGDDGDDAKAKAAYEAFSHAWMKHATARSVLQIVTPGWNNLRFWLSAFEPYYVAPWTKTNAMTRGKVAQFSCWEPITFHGEGFARTRPNDVFNYPVSEQTAEGMGSLTVFHPCPKPLAMWRDITIDYTEPGATILDPFAGSGTAIVAAEQTNRTAYVIELNPAYVAVILERLAGLGLTPKREPVARRRKPAAKPKPATK